MTALERYDIEYGEVAGRALTLDLYEPLSSGDDQPRSAVLVLHGGGWEGGDRRDADTVRDAAFFTSLGLLAVCVGYRLSGEAPAPAAAQDVRCAARWLRAHAGALKADPRRLVACGGSAGGHLALLLALQGDAVFPNTGGWSGESGRVNAAISYAGVTDVVQLLDGPHRQPFAARWLPFPEPERGDLARRLSPVDAVSPGAPPILLAHGDADHLVPFSQAERLHRALVTAGSDVTFHPIPGGGHGTWPAPASEDDYRRAKRAFLDRHGLLPGSGAARA